MWHNLFAISNTLRDMLCAKVPLPAAKRRRLEDGLSISTQNTLTLVLTHAARHLELHSLATRIRFIKFTQQPEENGVSAADSMTSILHAFLDDDTVIYAAPVVIPLLVPATATYLALKTNRGKANRQLGVYKEFLTAIEDNYPAATMLKRLLCAAQEAIVEKETGATWTENGVAGAESSIDGLDDLDRGIQFDLSWIDDAMLEDIGLK
ncbi:hypothetical protein BU23DRAFT_569100 [Bimuria novae-zelandiae CBS 107.79]|uniref:Uncharacterized protein n=1 Tax=Bimuria novae-zelandiae CBS 107.79 TaxID=1447943 RepID=A0A6A5VC35_9PLEO|nr:hypothetical protein BU23DRAFT_569100 [Bimuria novae-zelandiae CBS 107.79]